MDTTYSVRIKFAYEDVTSRTITFKNVENSALSDVKDKILALNRAVPESFKTSFVSDNGAPFIMISEAKIITTEEEVIYRAS